MIRSRTDRYSGLAAPAAERANVRRQPTGFRYPASRTELDTRHLQPYRASDSAGAHSPPAGAGCAVTTRRLTCTTVAIMTSITAAITTNIARGSPRSRNQP